MADKQIFEIELNGMVITPELISGLLRDYFISTIGRVEAIGVNEIVEEKE